MNNSEKHIFFSEIENTIKKAMRLTQEIEEKTKEEEKKSAVEKRFYTSYSSSSSTIIEECPICYEKKRGKVITACGHEYCVSCSVLSGVDRCVLCRGELCVEM